MRKSRFWIFALAVLCAGGMFLTGKNLFHAYNSNIIDDGVYIGSIDVSGMSTEEATAAVNAYVDELKTKSITLKGPKDNMTLTLGELGLTANTDAVVQKAAGTAKAGNLIARFMQLKDLEADNLVLDMELSIDKQLTGNLIHNKLDKLNIKAIDNGLKRENGKFIYVPGQTGNEVDIVTSVNALSDMLVADLQQAIPESVDFDLTSVVSEPRGSEEELAVVKDLMGTYSTDFSSSNAGRKKNLTTGAKKINGTLLYPGDVFSAHDATAPYTEANGYGVGGAFQDGKVIESLGGGICQVSTTLYNAAIRAELKITQRNPHSMVVSYVNPSEDAAIAGNYKDLKFRNDYDFPIYIEGYTSKGIITFNIYGKEYRDENREIRFEHEILTTDDPGMNYTLSDKQPLGYYKVNSSKHVGYTARLWKIISINGVDQPDRVRVNRSTYKASKGKATIGIAGATPEQIAAIKEAIATKDDAYIKQFVKGLTNPQPAPTPDPVPTPEPTPTPPPAENPEPTV